MTPIRIHYLQIFIHKISLFTYYEENDAQQDAYYKSQENLFSGPVAFFKNEFDLLGCDAVLSGGRSPTFSRGVSLHL